MFNLYAIVLGTLAWIIVESVLYNPMHGWGKLWARESGMGEKMKDHKMTASEMAFTFGGTAIAGILMAIGLNHTVQTAKTAIGSTFGVNPLISTLMLAFLTWLAFYGVGQFILAVYSGQSKKLIGLHMVNGLIGFLVMGLVIGLFQ
ncbi:MAG: DUF1761 domain-containing protein [Streptococcaceae bacterium]|jgi:hypothetical protein|nr:DUF1761 domain-containing protein [Streptococcaceae bacterium]